MDESDVTSIASTESSESGESPLKKNENIGVDTAASLGWPTTEVGYVRLDESDDSSIASIESSKSGEWSLKKNENISMDGLVVDNDSDDFSSERKLTYFEMGYTKGWGHGRIAWPRQ